MDAATARRLVEHSPVARLATVDPDGRAHIVPVTFSLVGARFATAVDWKPKRTTELQRLANVRRTGSATVLVDHYDDDWSSLWWVRMRGPARVLDAGSDEHGEVVETLAARYRQYAEHPPEGPAIVVDVDEWRGWVAWG